MELQFYGANCVRLSCKKASIVIDDNLSDLGAKQVLKPGEVAVYTTAAHTLPKLEAKLVVDQPGEYEVSDISIHGIAARAHMDEPGAHTATIYRVVIDDIRVAVVGHIYPELSSEQLEAIGLVDVLVVPVGGNGYTLDPIGALKVMKAIEPKIVVPTHYDDSGLIFPVPQQTLTDALKGLGLEPKDPVARLKIKSGELLESSQVVVLERQ
jgi:L-ascorbate metabolism protein UlaG (beta-lactamase superfamily)